jgi:hypothetical protein
MEFAHEKLERAVHVRGGSAPQARLAAVIIAVLAGTLAVTEFGAKDAQTAFLSHHIAASDTWNQYQAKSARRVTYAEAADLLESLPTASDPAVQKRIEAARANAERMRSEPGSDGMEQLAANAGAREHDRDHEIHRYHGLEIASSGLQLAIVLASISVVTAFSPLLVGAGLLGVASAGYAAVSWLALI